MDSLPINVADLAILGILVLSALLAFARGFVHEVLAIASWIGAALVTLYLFAPAQELSRQFIAIELVADLVAGVGLFLVALIVFSIFTRMIGRRARSSAFGFLDRSLGILFGLARGAVIVCLLWIVVAWLITEDDRPDWILEARALPLVEAGAEMLVSLAPADLRERAAETVPPPAPSIGLQPGLREEANGDNDSDTPPAGYNLQQRRELDRLFETQQ